jgi:hypothetical protein
MEKKTIPGSLKNEKDVVLVRFLIALLINSSPHLPFLCSGTIDLNLKFGYTSESTNH